MDVTYSGNGSSLHCYLNSGCNFLAVQPAGFVVDSLAQQPRAVAGFSALRSRFFTEQLLTAIPYLPGVPQQLDFREVQPSVYVTLRDVNITCGSLIQHSIPSNLPVPVPPQAQQVGVTTDDDLVDAIICAPLMTWYLLGVSAASLATPRHCTPGMTSQHWLHQNKRLAYAGPVACAHTWPCLFHLVACCWHLKLLHVCRCRHPYSAALEHSFGSQYQSHPDIQHNSMGSHYCSRQVLR